MLKADFSGIKKGDRIAVAVSGGRDSMALLELLTSKKHELGIAVIMIHFEHGIRGNSSIADMRFLEKYAEKQDIPIIVEQGDCKEYQKRHKVSLEQAARILRYRFFERVLSSGQADKIATAHHLDDECETVLMRLFRGTGIEGLTGIPSQGKYIRPLLSVSREEIDEYISQRGLEYRDDESNDDTDFTRNYIRHELAPLIEKRYPSYRKSISRLKAIAAEQVKLLDELAIPYDIKSEGVVALSSQQLISVNKAVAKHSIHRALAYLDATTDFEAVHFDKVLELASMPTGKALSLACGVTAVTEYGNIVFYRKKSVGDSMAFQIGSSLINGGVVTIRQYQARDRLRFDLSKVPQDAVIRTRQAGDIFQKFGGGTLSLGDYFTDKKIPLRKRDSIPLIACGNRILVIADVEISDIVKTDEKTVDIYTFTWEE